MDLFLIIAGGVVIYAGWLYVNPFTDCSWCKGTGKNRLRTRKTYGRCKNPRCTRGTVQRLGSKTIHRAVRGLVSYRRNNREK